MAQTQRSAIEIEKWVVTHVAAALGLQASQVDPLGDLPSLSLDSMKAVEMSAKFQEWLGRPVPPTLLWDHATIRELAEALARTSPD